MNGMKTYSLKAGEIIKAWHILDAENVPLGRLASRAAVLLRGKHKPTYSPHLDMGDFVVVVNAEKVKLSGNEVDKKYYRHSGFPGGLHTRTFRELQDRFPTRIVEFAVKGMLPHNRLGARVLGHLKVYAGPAHPHEAQMRAGTGARALKRAEAVAAAPKPARRAPAPRAEALAAPIAEAPVTAAAPAVSAAKKPAPKARAEPKAKAATNDQGKPKATARRAPAKKAAPKNEGSAS